MAESQEFVDRDNETQDFESLLCHDQHRVLLITGLPGLGKTALVTEMYRMCRRDQVLAAIVDLGGQTKPADPEDVINQMGRQLKGPLRDRIRRAQAENDLAFASVLSEPAIEVSVPEAARSVEMAMATLSRSSSAGVRITDAEVPIGGDLVGGNKTTLINPRIYVSAGGGTDFARARSLERLNDAFCDGIEDLQAERKVVLFFDHYEQATDTIAPWLVNEVLALHLDLGTQGDYPNLWIVVAGRDVPGAEEVREWRGVMCSQTVGPIPDIEIRKFAIKKLGLERSEVDLLLVASKRNTKLLFLLFGNVQEETQAEEGNG